MSRVDGQVRTARLVATGIGVLCLLAVGVAASTSGTPYDPFNTGWNGTSELWDDIESDGARTSFAHGPGAYDSLEPSGTAVLVISPERDYDDGAVDGLRRFVRSGGTVIVADDFTGNGNDLLSALGADARFDGSLLRDDLRYWGAPTRPIAESASSDRVTLNRGTSVRPNGATPLYATSEFAYLDVNGSGDLDSTESMGELAVVTRESVGGGHVVAVGDPSVFVNGMREAPGNRGFGVGLFDGYERVVFDLSHGQTPPALASGYLLLQRSPPFQAGVGLLGIAVIALFARFPPGRPPSRGIVRRIRARREDRGNE